MKTITMTHFHAISAVTFINNGMADAAYLALKDALAKYREYRSEDVANISFATETGEHTVVLRGLQVVAIRDDDQDEALAPAIFARDARINALAKGIYAAQGIETRSAKTEGLGPKDESPVPEGDAPSQDALGEPRRGG